MLTFFTKKTTSYLLVPLIIIGILLAPMPWPGGGIRLANADAAGAADWGARGVAMCAYFGAYALVCGAIGGILGYFFSNKKKIDQLYKEKEYELDPAERKRAREDLTELQKKVLELYRTGNKGDPTAVDNWFAFIQKTQDKGRDHISDMVYEATLKPGAATVCPYFADSIAEAFDAKPSKVFVGPLPNGANRAFRIDSKKTFDQEVKCTLPDNFDINAYLRGENYSSDTVRKMLESQNTWEGVFQAALIERAKQTARNEDAEREKLSSNGGNTGVVNGEGVTLTAGAVLNQVAAHVAGGISDADWLVATDENKELVDGNIPAQAADRLANLSGDGGAARVAAVENAETSAADFPEWAAQAILDGLDAKISQDQLEELERQGKEQKQQGDELRRQGQLQQSN